MIKTHGKTFTIEIRKIFIKTSNKKCVTYVKRKNKIRKKCKTGLWLVRLNTTKVSILPKLTFNLSHFKSKPKLDMINLMFTCKNS